MEIRVIGQLEVKSLLTMTECIEVISDAFREMAKGETLMPRRLVMWLPNRVGALACMPAYMQNTGLIGLKAISAFPGNHGTEYDPHQGVVMLFDGACGFPIAIVDAREITAVRTAAASAVATRLLARKDASDLVLLGSGVQARKHLEAMRAVRPISRVRVWNPFPGLARKFAESEQVNQGIAIEALEGERADVTGADIICTVTSSTEPVLFGSDIPEGVHINAVGSSFPHARELDSEVVTRANLFVDLRESTLNEAGDFLYPLKEGLIAENHIRGELGEILTGKVCGRESDREITLFESLGVAVEDLAATELVYRKAIEQGAGVTVSL